MRWIIRKFPLLRYRNRSLGFTSLGTKFVLLTLAVGISAINTGNNLLYLILAMMLSFIILSGILSEQSLRGLHADRMLPAHLFAGRTVPVHIKISNRKRRLSSFSFTVSEIPGPAVHSQPIYVYTLPADRSLILSTTTTFRMRGRQSLPGMRFETTFPFGFFKKSLTRPVPHEVVVFPALMPLPGNLGSVLGGLGEAREVHAAGHGGSVRNLRSYLPRDDARNIHWKASARGGSLLIKEFEEEEERRLVLSLYNVVPPGNPRKLERFEQALSLTASIAYYFLMRDHAVEIRTVDGFVPMGKGMAHLLTLLRFLGLLEAAAGPALLRRPPGSSSDEADAHLLILPDDACPPGISFSNFTRVIAPSDWAPAGGRKANRMDDPS